MMDAKLLRQRYIKVTCTAVLLINSVGCVQQNTKTTEVDLQNQKRITVGVVQKEVREGMTSTEVLKVLGSPNIVTSGGGGVETWVYDMSSTETQRSSSGGYASLILIGASSVNSTSTRSEKTLTIILEFASGILKEFSYHSTRF